MFERLMEVLTKNGDLKGKLFFKDGVQHKNIDGRNIGRIEQMIKESDKVRINQTITIHDKKGKATNVVIAMGTIQYEEVVDADE